MIVERSTALLSDRSKGMWLAVGVAALVYMNAAGLGFAYDDVEIIRDNAALHSWGAILDGLAAPYWPGHYAAEVGVWRPVVTFWWGAQWMLWGDSPALFHLVGIALHAAATGLLVVVLCEFLPVAAAVLGGLVFAVHPLHVEAVSNIIGNAEVIAALFVFSALLVHLRAGGMRATTARYGWGRALAVGVLFLGGALTKEIAYTLPALLFLVDAARDDIGLGDLRGYLAQRWRPYSVLGVSFAGLILARSSILGGVAPPQAPSGAILLEQISRVWTVPATWTHYVRLLFFPLDLNADYGGIIPVLIGWGPRNLTGVALALVFLGLAWWGWRTGPPLDPGRGSRRVLGLAVVWFGVTILPAANIVFLSPVLVAERNLYLPSVGLAAAAGWLLAELVHRRREAGLFVTAALVVVLSARTVTRTPVWNDTAGLFADLLERHPEAGRAWYFHADRLFKAGRQPEARRAFSVLLLLTDSDYAMASEVGARLSAMDGASPRAAEFLLERAWRERPEAYTAPGFLAAHYLNHAQYRQGEAPARAAVALAPENADMYRVLAALLSGQGRPAEAIPFRLSAIARGGGAPWTPWVWLAGDYAAVGDTTAALMALDSAKARAPSPGAVAAVEARLLELKGRDDDASPPGERSSGAGA